MAPATSDSPEHALEKFQANFWAKQITTAEAERPDAKHAALPLARIKKVMKSDPDVKVHMSVLNPARRRPLTSLARLLWAHNR